jgi:hypothetical protein
VEIRKISGKATSREKLVRPHLKKKNLDMVGQAGNPIYEEVGCIIIQICTDKKT